VTRLSTSLDPSRFEVHVASLQTRGALYEQVSSRGLPVSTYEICSLVRSRTIRQQLRFAAYLKEHAIDIVHLYGFYPIVFGVPAARLARAPVVVTSIRDNGDQWTKAQRLAQRFTCRLAHCTLVNAEAVRTRLVAEGYRHRSIAVIRNGVDVNVDRRPDAPGGSLRESLGLPSKAPLIVAVSRLNPLKGIDDFLEAARLLAGRFRTARFIVVGYGPSREELEVRAHLLGVADRVIFTGARLDVADILSQATISVAPSLSEALPNVVLESMAVGAPLVATRVGGTPEVVEDGVSGLLVPPCDAPALAAAIGHLLENPRIARRLGDAARMRAAGSFSMSRMVSETEDLYRSLLKGERPAAMQTEHGARAATTLAPPPAVMARRRRELWDLSRQWTPL
jgi:glycosyltransferase involved in cell wall biosynthesis